MRLALAVYALTARANTPHCDLDLLYHDGRAHRLDKRLVMWLSPSPRRGAHSSGTSVSANLKTGLISGPSERRSGA
jgi:hypothetical protein